MKNKEKQKEVINDAQQALSFGNVNQAIEDKLSLAYQINKMDDKSIEFMQNELREAYMQMKDLKSRCMIDMENITKSDQRMFYFKPNSIFLEDPEQQRQFRQKFIKNISKIKELQFDGKVHLADQFEQDVRESIFDKSLSDPGMMRPYLSDFFKRRLYFLQHKKQKILVRWAHFALTSFSVDQVGSYGTQVYGRLEYETENCLKRYERLLQKDGFEELRDGKIKRPQTNETNDLTFLEKTELQKLQDKDEDLKLNDRSKDPISCIKVDDFDVYLRIQTYQNKIYRSAMKFLARAKWVTINKSIDILKEYHIRFTDMQKEKFEDQVKYVVHLRKRFKNSLLKKTDDIITEMEEVFLEDYESARLNLQNQMLVQAGSSNQNQKELKKKQIIVIQEKAPLKIQNIIEMYDQIENLAKKFQIIGNVEIDNGFSFCYQVQVFFMTYYQKQIIESTFSRYNQLAKDPQISTKQAMNLQITGYSNTREATKIQNLIFQMNSDLRDILNPTKSDIDKLYEKFDGDFAQDFSEVQKRNLQQILMMDFMLLDLQNSNSDGTSLPLLKKGKKINEQIPDLKKFFENVRICRMKKSVWVESQILIQPNISFDQQNQDQIFSNNFFPDLQLKSLLDFIDINDPSMVNVLYQSLSKLYEAVSKQSYGINYVKEGVKLSSEIFSDETSKKFYDSFTKCIQENISQNEHLSRISREQIAELKAKRFINQERRVIDTIDSNLRKIPAHLVQCYMTLKHMNMRNSKDRLLKILNFYRSVQKRIYLELQSFAMKESINNNVKIKIPEEAYYVGTKAQSLEEKFIDAGNQKKKGQKGKTNAQKKTEFELEENENISTLIDIKRWKYQGKFNNKFLATCPMPFSIEGFAEKPQLESEYNSYDQNQIKMHISELSKDFLNRIDLYQVNEDLKEILVFDDFGVNVMYEASIQDMIFYEQYLLQIGTYFIKKTEGDFDLLKYEFSFVDRMQTLDDLLNEELEYQFLKSQIIMAYLDALEHQCDPLIQQRLMQIIVDIMAWKPKIDHQRQWYFLNSYKAEKRYLQTLLNFLKEISSFQIENEKNQNQKIKDFLNLSFKVANTYTKMEWTDADTNQIPNEIKERQYVINGNRQNQDSQPGKNENENSFTIDQKSAEKKKEQPDENQNSKTKSKIDSIKNEQKSKHAQMEENKKSYLQQLGIKEPNKKDQLINQATLDPDIEDYIEKDANYIKNQEGFPCFFKKGSDTFSNVSFSNPTSFYNPSVFGVLDFYESLSILTNVFSLLQQGQSELKQSLRPAGPIQLNVMNTIYIEKLYVEFVKVKEQKYGNSMMDYEAQQSIENDLISGNPDKLVFLVKDMVSQFNKSTKRMMNPFLIGKLDLGTINHFPFPKFDNSYFQDENKGNKMDVHFTRNYIDTQIKPKNQQYHFFPKLRDDDRNITVPAALFLFCNLAEILRLQELLIINLVETKVLEECYNYQKKQLNLDSFEVQSKQPLYISCNPIVQEGQLNYIEDGSLLYKHPDMTSGLAIDEICPTLRSNLNFSNPDSIQSLVLDSGLSNLKVSLHYQIVQRQILTLSVLQNNYLMFPYMRALCEIELINQEGIKMVNGIIDQTKFTNGAKKSIDYDKLNKLKSFYGSLFYQNCANIFFNVNKHKTEAKNQIKVRWEEYKKKLEVLGADPTKLDDRFEIQEPKKLNLMTLIRILTDYKAALVHISCRQLSNFIIENSFKVELLHITHSELKPRLNYFGGLGPENHVFKLEDSHSQETDHPYLQVQDLMVNQQVFQKINQSSDGEFPPSNICTIPSTKSIINLKIFPNEKLMNQNLFEKYNDICLYKDKDFDYLVYMNFTLQFNQQNYLQKIIFKLFEKEQIPENSSYLETLKQQSLPSKMLKLYQIVLNIFEIFHYQVRVNIKPVDSIEIQNSVDQGLKYWQTEEAQNPIQKKYNTAEQEQQDNLLEQTINIEDENLSQKIVEKIMQEKRQQVQVFDDFMGIVNKFKELIKYLESKFGIQNYKLDSLLKYLKDHHRYLHLETLKGFLQGFDKLFKSEVSPYILKENISAIKLLTGIDFQTPYFFNGILINSNFCNSRALKIQNPINTDFHIFQKITAGLEFSEDLIPSNCNLLLQLFQTFQNEEILSNKQPQFPAFQNLNYIGQLHFKDGLLSSDLKFAFQNLSEKEYQKVRFQQNSFDTNFRNLMASKEMGNHSNLEQTDSDVLIEILQNHVDSLFLKIVYMILLTGRTIPKYLNWQIFNRDFSLPLSRRIQWRINQYMEAETKRLEEKQKLKEKFSGNISQVEKGPQEVKKLQESSIQKTLQVSETVFEGRSVEQINQVEAVKSYLEIQCQYKVLQNEINKIFIQASIYAMDVQIGAIERGLEMCSNKIDKNIPPSQGFCATLYDDINRHPHLEVVYKLPQIQVFLTKLRNRGLPIKTLTSGQGIVCTFKDLNECIHDFCQEMLTFGEKQLKIRTDSYQYQINQLIEIIQYKDTKIQALKTRSAYVYENIQRVTNSKVLESGNALVYSLDRAMQEVRFYQEHINSYESELKKAIFDQFRKKVQMQDQLISKQNINIFNQNEYLSHFMSDFIAKEQIIFNDKIRQLKNQTVNLDDFNQQQLILQQQLIKDKNEKQNKTQQKHNLDTKNYGNKLLQNQESKAGVIKHDSEKPNEKAQDENFAKEDAFTIIIKLQDKLVKQRSFWDMKYFLLKQKLEEQIHFLENKLSSNKDLWEKLTNEEVRQKTLIKELSVTQHESQQNERLIENLQDQLDNSRKQQQVLENIGKTKQSQIQVLEYKTKGIDLNKNYNVEKLIEILISQDKQINELKKNELYWKSRMQQCESEFNVKKNILQKQIELEMETKASALKQIEQLQQKIKSSQFDSNQLIKDNAAHVWKQKFEEMLKLCQKLAQENQILSQKLGLKNDNVKISQQINQKERVKEGIQQKYSPFSKARDKNLYKQSTYQGVNQLIFGNIFPQKQIVDNDANSQTTKTSNKSPIEQDINDRRSTFEQGNLFMNNLSVSHSNKYQKSESESNILNHTDKFIASEFHASQLDEKNLQIENLNKSKLTSDDDIEFQNIKTSFFKIQEPVLYQNDKQINIKSTNYLNQRKQQNRSELSEFNKKEINLLQPTGSDSNRLYIPKLNVYNKNQHNIESNIFQIPIANQKIQGASSLAILPKSIEKYSIKGQKIQKTQSSSMISKNESNRQKSSFKNENVYQLPKFNESKIGLKQQSGLIKTQYSNFYEDDKKLGVSGLKSIINDKKVQDRTQSMDNFTSFA